MAEEQNDQRLLRLEHQIESISRRMTEMLQAFQAREESSANRPQLNCRNADGEGTSGGVAPKVTKLDFPRYDGTEDPTLWISRVEQFFGFQNIAVYEQVRLAIYHLDGDAQLWVQRQKALHPDLTWRTMKEGIIKRFGISAYENSFADLCRLPTLSTRSA